MKQLFWLVVFGLMMSQAGAGLAIDGGLVVQPPMKSVVLNSDNKSVEFGITYTNTTTALISLKLSVIDFGALDEAGGVAFLGLKKDELENKYGLASWVGLSESRVNLMSGANKTIKVKVQNRESLSPGGHYAAVLATVEQEGDDKGKVVLNQSLGTLIYAGKIGGEKYGLKFNKLETTRLWWTLADKVSVRFQNYGNVHVVPRGLVVVKDWRGNEVARGVVNAESAVILPETYRWFGLELRSNKKWVWPGRYLLNLDFRYEGKGEADTKKVEFWYLGKEGLILLVLVGMVSAGFFALKSGKR